MSVDPNGYPWVHSEQGRLARSILVRLGHDPSFAELWKRLERAEADRDRMMNALQVVLDRNSKERFLPSRVRTLIHRALSRIQPVRPDTHPNPGQSA